MRSEPIEFGSVGALRAKPRALDVTHSIHGARKPDARMSGANVIDEAFAGFSDDTPNRAPSSNWRSATRELVAEIAAQLELLDRQRRELTRLLESVPAQSTAE